VGNLEEKPARKQQGATRSAEEKRVERKKLQLAAGAGNSGVDDHAKQASQK